MSHRLRRILFFLAGLFVSVGFDQYTKGLAARRLMGRPAFVLCNGVFELVYSENRGAAFGMLQGKQALFFVIALAVVAVAGWILWRMPPGRRYAPFTGCLFLLVSGAAGNMIDRLSQGYVVDFFYFSLIDFPVFNVADCYVVISTALLFLLFFAYYKEEELEFLSFGKKGQ